MTCELTRRVLYSNQLGYTTPAIQGRTSFYATDLAKSISAPVLHVNGDRIDDVARCLKLAFAYQRKFRKDVIVDLVVYRRLGHNELDEPSVSFSNLNLGDLASTDNIALLVHIADHVPSNQGSSVRSDSLPLSIGKVAHSVPRFSLQICRKYL